MSSITAPSYPAVMHDGTEFRLSPLTDRDMDELEAGARARYVALVVGSLPPELDKAERRELIDKAVDEAKTITMMNDSGQELIARTNAGQHRMIWVMCRREHPDLTLDMIREYLLTPKNRETFLTTVKLVNKREADDVEAAVKADPPAAA